MPRALIRHLCQRLDETVTLRGWLVDPPVFSTSEAPPSPEGVGGESEGGAGDQARLQVRDGSGLAEALISRSAVSEEAWEDVARITRESTLRLTGVARARDDAPGGVEIRATDFTIDRLAEPLPATDVTPVYLALRAEPRRAVLRLRSEVFQALQDFFRRHELTRVDLPPVGAAPDEPYLRAASAALGRVYSLGPTVGGGDLPGMLDEGWMAAVELAFLEFDGLLGLAGDLMRHVVSQVAERCAPELAALGREAPVLPATLPQQTFEEAAMAAGLPVDFGGDDPPVDLTEAQLARAAPDDTPAFFLTRPPAALRAVDLQPDPKQGTIVLGFDWVTTEGWTLMRGGQRLRDVGRLERRLAARGLAAEEWGWSLDLRRFGGFPASGFVLSIEGLVAWIGGLSSPAEAVAFPLRELVEDTEREEQATGSSPE